MQQLILTIHVLVALAILGLVLLQHGKGADVGASFGSGAANTMFGSVGPASFLMKLTGLLGCLFFATSILLTYVGAKRHASQMQFTPSTQQQQAIPAPSTDSSKTMPERSFAPPAPDTSSPLGHEAEQ